MTRSRGSFRLAWTAAGNRTWSRWHAGPSCTTALSRTLRPGPVTSRTGWRQNGRTSRSRRSTSPRKCSRSHAFVVRARLRRALRISGGDLSSLPFATASLDAVTAGYALRNTPDWRASVVELSRAIRPGGHLFTLDFYLPVSGLWREAFLGWLSAAGRAVGWWWHREPMAYGYIARSIAHFTTAPALRLAPRGIRVPGGRRPCRSSAAGSRCTTPQGVRRSRQARAARPRGRASRRCGCGR